MSNLVKLHLVTYCYGTCNEVIRYFMIINSTYYLPSHNKTDPYLIFKMYSTAKLAILVIS